jgi:putative ABC transport system permease protein
MRFPDLTLAVRNLGRRPAFAATAILLLALGSGANAAVFSIVRGILLKPLPYQQPERLVSIWPSSFVSNDELQYWRDRTRSFQAIGAVSPGWMMSFVADGVEPLKVTGARTSDNFFTTLGVTAAVGRTLMPGDAVPSQARVAVISAALFERYFGSDPKTIGRSVSLDTGPHTIVGVMPRGFEFLEPGTDVWAPLPVDPSSPQHRAQFSQAFGRLNPGVTVDAATRELQALLPAMRGDLGKPNDWANDLRAAPLLETVTGDVRPTLLILLAAVGLILLLAAVNLGTLVLGRSIERAREMAVRTALGASRTRLVRQLIVEQAVIAAAGALAGLALARVALPTLVSRIPPEMPRQGDIALDVVVFFSVFAASVAIAILMAFVPVVIAARPELQPLLRQTQSTETPSRRRALGILVAAQVALAIVLGIGAGLMLRSLWNLQNVDPGFRASNVLTFRLQTTARYAGLAKGLPYFEQVLERIRALPGVAHVGSIQHLPMTGYNWTSQVYRLEQPPAPGATPPNAVWRFIGWDYFRTMGIALRAGRDFTAQDHLESTPVAIVNEAFARREFGEPSAAIGRQVVSVRGAGKDTVEIVGVIGDVRFVSLDKPATAEMYRPLAQTFMFPMAFVVRTNGDPAQLATAVRQAVFAVDPTIPVADLQPLTSLIASTLGRPRLLAMLLSVFAGVGLLLGVIGVYGVVAYRVRQREREFGIRLALGADPDRIASSVLRQGAGYAALGALIGLPAALALTRLMESVVFGVTTHDLLTFAALPTAVAVTTLMACALPARRAARVDPALTMKSE